jgi:hypothetical protein
MRMLRYDTLEVENGLYRILPYLTLPYHELRLPTTDHNLYLTISVYIFLKSTMYERRMWEMYGWTEANTPPRVRVLIPPGYLHPGKRKH